MNNINLSEYIGNKIRYYRNNMNLTQDDLAKKLKTTKATISNYETGYRSPKQDSLFELADIFDISIDDLFPPRESNVIPLNSNDTDEYPLYDVGIAAGALADIGSFLEDDCDTIAISNSVMGKYTNDEDIFITYVNGDSMNNVIPDESLIAVKQLNSAFDLENGDIVVFRNGTGLSVKRFYNDKQERHLVFRPDSSYNHFTDMVISYDDIEDLQIYGKVVVYVVNL